MASLASEFDFDGIDGDAEDSLLEVPASSADGELWHAWQAVAERWLRLLMALAFIAATAALWWPADAGAQKVATVPAVAQTASVSAGSARRIKEVAAVQGVRSNQLVGYGLVVGLDGTGDQTTQTPFTTQSLQAMLQQLGITVPPGTSMQLRNVAAVLVTAQLPAFATPGQTIDVSVSSVGNAKSLRGGTLIATPLKGADGQIYALAQGNLIVGGAGASAGGSKVQINHLSAGRVPEGATVERSVPTPLMDGETLQLGLNASDFATARAVADAINAAKGAGTASALDGRTIRVKAPRGDERVGFLADIENLPISMARPAARIVLNARTGSIVMNEAVTLAACAVAHGNLSVTITNTPVVSQPAPLSGGQTVARDRTDISVTQHPGALIQMGAGAKLTDVVKALSALGATPLDLLGILQAMKSAGALNAEIEVI
jgi:flagellar P-ring protein precursor FlgI